MVRQIVGLREIQQIRWILAEEADRRPAVAEAPPITRRPDTILRPRESPCYGIDFHNAAHFATVNQAQRG